MLESFYIFLLDILGAASASGASNIYAAALLADEKSFIAFKYSVTQ